MNDLDLIPSKLLALLIRPDFWLWLGILTAFGAVWRGWKRLALWVLASLVATVTLVGFVPAGSVWLTPLEARFPTNPQLQEPPTAIIVPGGGEDTATSAAWDANNINKAGDRITHAMRRATQFPGVPVLFTGGAFDPTGDPLLQGGAERVAALLAAMGLEESRIHIGALARTTAEHPADITAFLDALDLTPTEARPLLLVTSAFHMPRAMGVLCAADLGPVLADPTDHRTTPGRAMIHALRWEYADHLTELQIGIREWVGLIAYRLAGHTDALLPGGCSDPD